MELRKSSFIMLFVDSKACDYERKIDVSVGPVAASSSPTKPNLKIDRLAKHKQTRD